MKNKFKNKVIVFLGDSITGHGFFLYNIRSFLMDKKEKCYLFNRGIGGHMAITGKYFLQGEVLDLKPDICFISYGVNDMGVWLYDCQKEETPELLAKREERDKIYFDNMKEIAVTLKNNGITPIFMTPFCLSENISEREDIETIADNKEKENYIGPSFYKRATFAKLNEALRGYSEKLKLIAKEIGIEVFDMFSETYNRVPKNSDNYAPDGIHYTAKGHDYLAKFILEYLGFENVPIEFKKYDKIDKLSEVQHWVRQIQGCRKWLTRPGNTETHESLKEKMLLECETSTAKYIRERKSTIIKWWDNYQELLQLEKNLVYNLYK